MNKNNLTPFKFKNEIKNITEIEEEIMNEWINNKIFEKSLKRGNKSFVFYDGPPFATGTPHYGHLLAGTIKDIICRHNTLKGYNVERKAGWDTHGIPIEMLIEKKLKREHNIELKEDIIKYGIKKYNDECRNIVMSCVEDWIYTTNRIGRWIDFVNDYKTMDINFMESEWWVFKELYNKNLVYNGYKIMHYSLGAKTQLSNSEANMNYKEKNVDSLYVEFPIIKNNNKKDKFNDCNLLIWTTTTWTLPSNLTICINPKIKYIKLLYKDKKYIIAKKCINDVLCITKKNKDKIKYEILDEFLGEELKNISYEPLFDYYIKEKEKNNKLFTVICDEYIEDNSGTGLTHISPAFGEDDYRVCLENGIIDEENLKCCIDDNGNFKNEIYDLSRKYIFDCDNIIINKIKKNSRLFLKKNIKHRVAYCYRTDTPLIYKACRSLFIKVTEIKDKLIENNNKTYWIPNDVKTNRFHNWLENARDWAISRTRFWGTPIPLWVSEDLKDYICIGSIDELKRLSNLDNIEDLHREVIDEIIIVKNGKKYKRIEDVFDCWFESASMPYGQLHYPFENKEYFENNFPGDFIAEGLDQTRGWFYNLLVISTALFNKPAFKNVIVNGIVKAEDGKKMSKSLKNYPNPLDLINKFGADAVRVYLIHSKLTKAQEIKFNENDVFDMVKNITIPIYNSLNLLNEHYGCFKKNNKLNINNEINNVLDKWILEKNNILIENIKKELDEYKLYNIYNHILIFIELLNNGYNKINRDYIKGKYSIEDWNNSLSTLYKVLYNLSIILSPIMPFFAEYLYKKLNLILKMENVKESVHLLEYNDIFKNINENKINSKNVDKIICILDIINRLRDKNNLPLKRALKDIKLYCTFEYKKDIEELKEYILVEGNILEVIYCNIEERTIRKLKVNHRTLGMEFKKDKNRIVKYIEQLTEKEIEDYIKNGEIKYENFIIKREHLEVNYKIINKDDKIMEYNESEKILIEISLEYNSNIENLYYSRLLSTEIQTIRREQNLDPSIPIKIYYNTKNNDLEKCIKDYHKEIKYIIRCPLIYKKNFNDIEKIIIKTNVNLINKMKIELCLSY